jgi:hypothetical protein
MQEFENTNFQDPSEMKTVRRSRSTDNRSFETRSANERPPIAHANLSRFNVKESIRKKYKDMGYSLCWIPYQSGGLELKESYFKALDRGYDPLMTSEEPDLCRNYNKSPFGKNSTDNIDEFIPTGGQILMKIKDEVRDSELDHYDGEGKRDQYMSEMHMLAKNNPSVPRPFMDHRSRGI